MGAKGVKFLMEVMFVFLFASQNPRRKQNQTLTNPYHTPLNLYSYSHLI